MVEFRSLEAGLATRSELFPAPPAFALLSFEHPTLQSFIVVPGVAAPTFYQPPQGDRRVVVCVAHRNLQHRLLVVLRFHLSLLPLRIVGFGELWTILGEIAPAPVVGLS